MYQNNCITGSKSDDISTGNNCTASLVHLSVNIVNNLERLCPQTQVWWSILLAWSASRSIK